MDCRDRFIGPTMKPAPFEYIRPTSIDEACALLAADDNARLIAGGQTLVPMMAMRLARPTRLIDIARIPALSFVREERDALVIGAATRQCVVETIHWYAPRAAAARACHALHRALRNAGARYHRWLARQCRSRGRDRAGRGHARRDSCLS
jgi:CO/xanthine dehydrogenase FAD-binding subunit